jgi:hypothetical protein
MYRFLVAAVLHPVVNKPGNGFTDPRKKKNVLISF